MTGGTHYWFRSAGGNTDRYYEAKGGAESNISDLDGAAVTDTVRTQTASPSQPMSALNLTAPGPGDDAFLDALFFD